MIGYHAISELVIVFVVEFLSNRESYLKFVLYQEFVLVLLQSFMQARMGVFFFYLSHFEQQ